MKQTWEFSAIDTLFFKEARPMEAPGSSELNTVFPPPMRTLAGAIRSYIGENWQTGVDWQAFRKAPQHKLRNIIGYGDDFADQLQFQGVWIHYKGERYYPAPLNLMAKRDDEGDRSTIEKLGFLEIVSPCKCDLGKNVRLAKLPKSMQGSKPLNMHWLNTSGMQKILRGEIPDKQTELVSLNRLRDEEHRLGIARDKA